MPQVPLWLRLVSLLVAFNAGTAGLSQVPDCHTQCLIDCPPGLHYTSGNCLECPVGFYCLGGRTAPRLCPVGTFNRITGLGAITGCQVCPPGYISSETGSHCWACPDGYACEFQTGILRICKPGEYSPKGELSCKPCPIGHTCPDGRIRERCPSGQEPSPQLTHCVLCPRGYFSLEGDPGCQPCPEGHYCPYLGTTQPLPCPPNASVSVPGQTKCQGCGEGDHCVDVRQQAEGFIQSEEPPPLEKGNKCPLCPTELHPWTGHFCPDGITIPPCPSGTFEAQREILRFIETISCSIELRKCLQCPAGHFCPPGVTYPNPCQAGTFSPFPGQDEATDCIPCPAGRACTQMGLAQPDSECFPGFVCPVGSSSPYSLKNACPPGTYSDHNNLFDLSQCEPCPAGLVCTAGTGGVDRPPHPCPTGHYCPMGTKYSTQFQCPPGTWSNQTGLVSEKQCVLCPAGWFCVIGAHVPSGRCPAGHYCPPGSKWGTQFPCPPGTYSFQMGNDQSTNCSSCPPGAYCPSGTPKPVLCPRGTYRPKSGAWRTADCVPCPGGHHCPELGTTDPLPCATGSYSSSGQLLCQECPEGKFCNGTGLTEPLVCPPGHYCPANSMLPTQCPVGTFRTAPGATVIDSCQACSPGMFCGRAGLTGPEGLCDPGYYCGRGSNTSSPVGFSFGDLCPKGHYCPAGTTDSEQSPCPVGTWNKNKGAEDLSWCLSCPPGFFCDMTGGAAPAGLCAPGFYCTGGTQTPRPVDGLGGDLCPVGHACPEGSSFASPCREGHHSNGSGQESCFPCPAGSYCPGGQKKICPRGSYCPKGTGSFPCPCPQGTFGPFPGLSQRQECQPCLAGMFCEEQGLESPSGPCQSGFFCSEGATVADPDGVNSNTGGPCPPGHFCPAGTSVPLPCPMGTFSDRHFLSEASECLTCPPGFFCGFSGLSSPSGPCSAGYFCLAGAFSPVSTGISAQGGPCPVGHFCPKGSSLPHPCLAGTYNNLSGQEVCFPCPAGYFCPENVSDYSTQPCPPGFYCPRGTKYATQFPCPRGYYNPDPLTQSLDSCLPCPPGYYCGKENLTQVSGKCDAGWFCVSAAWAARPFDLDNYTSTNCLCPATATGGKCPSGSYCPEGSSEPIPCPSGSYCNASGLSTTSGVCQAGYYCAEGATSPDPDNGVTGDLCPAGTYCPAGSHRPTPCPPGTFSNIPGQVAFTSCLECPSGFYCKDAGLKAPSGQCPEGYYCDSRTGPVKDFHLYPCPQGFYCPLGTTWSRQNSCPVGTFGPRLGLKDLTECQLCPAGKFCAVAGLSTPTGDCAEGHWCKEGAYMKNPTDGVLGLLCPAGNYCPTGTRRPVPCPPGTWSKEGNRNLDGCQTGIEGHFCNSSRPLSLVGLCHPKFHCTEEAILASPTDGEPCYIGYFCPQEMNYPTFCPFGSYMPFTNPAECCICPSGQYCVPGQKPQLCPRGFYCPEGTGVDWQPCPAGTYGPVPGLSSLVECRACDKGKFCLKANATDVTGECWAGYFCPGGSRWPNPEPGTEGGSGPCPQGHYCPKGSSVPQPCPLGTFSQKIKLTSEADCSPCPPGHYCNATGLTSPSGQCREGFFCLGGAIIPNNSHRDHRGGPCPIGHFCPRGSVTPQVCLAGSYNPLPGQRSCELCPQGFFCPENSSSLDGNECPAGHYCPPATASASQFPCPRGTYNPQKSSGRLSDCILCDPGMYCPVPGLAKPSGPCNMGFYCTRGSSLPNPTDGVIGNLCPSGHSCPQGSPEPVPCPPGSFLPFPGSQSSKDCQPCPAGWFCSQSGLGFPEAACEGGWFCPVASISGHSPGCLCPFGHYCPPGSPEPQLCPAGQYQDETGQSQCKLCPAGKFCPSRVQLSEPKDPHWPVDCPTGYFCPPGTESSTQHPCPRGTFSKIPGTSSPEECPPCPAGQFCNSAMYVHGPELCPQGHFCPPGTQSPTEHPCPPGTFGPRTGATSELNCEPCPAGMYCFTEGLSQPSGLCYSGHYCTGGAASPTPIKHKVETPGYSENDVCPPGFFCPNGTYSPLPCPPGSYSSTQGLETEEQCQPCPTGKYCSMAGLANPSQAAPCSPGYICLEGSVSPSPSNGIQGYRCPRGFYCLPGASIELPCEPGTFSPMPGMSTCFPCPAGTFCQQAASVEPTICPKGHFCPAHSTSALPCPEGTLNPLEGALSLNACQSCPVGRYCSKEGSWQPGGLCSAGYYCEGGAAWPIPQKTTAFPLNGPCPKGHYCPEGTLNPLPCPIGTLRNITGGSSEGSCQPCPAGFFCTALGLSSPKGSCAAGFYCPTNLSSSNSTDFLCPQGHFCPSGAAHPTPCLLGQYQPNQGSTSCLPCPPGFYCPDYGTKEPKLCPAHAYCPTGTWSPPQCPQGTFTSQDTVGLKEEGDCSVCPPGHYCRSGQLLGKCPAGFFCPTGNSELMLPGSGESLTSCPIGQLCASKCPTGFYCPEGSEVPIQCPAHTIGAAPGARKKEDCWPCPPGRWCKAGDPTTYPCPDGHYCPGGNESYLGAPQECPEHTYQPAIGAQSRTECQSCPPGYHCTSPGLSSFEDHLCPPGHWCPGEQGALLCPPGTFRTDPGASSWEECKPCAPGHYCPDPGLTGLANIFGVPCRAGSECPAGASSETICRAGFYCGPQTGDPSYCPSGYICPEGSSTYTGLEQLCRFPYYCPLGSARGLQCPGGYEALNISGLRVSAETCCRVCEAGTYRSLTLAALPCQPCPAGFSCPPGSESYLRYPCPAGYYCPSMTPFPRPCPPGTFGNSTQGQQVKECHPCPAGTFSPLPGQTGCFPCSSSSFSPPGASHCTCHGLNRAFQKSDGSCICLAGHVSYDERGQESYDSNSNQDCQPQVEERCSLGDIRLAATRKCVSPKQHNCSSFCHPTGGELNTELGICQCQEYISAEELCDTLCLTRAPRLSLKWNSNKELFLTIQDQDGGTTHREIKNTVGPDQPTQRSEKVHLVQLSPHGIFGFIFSRVEVLDIFMMDFELDPLLVRHRREISEPEQALPPKTHFFPGIPNPVVCLQMGESILFQLNLLPDNRRWASHYPVYQKQHLFNNNPQWDFGAFRRLNHLVQETHLNFSRFAHVFLDPGTYVFQDNGLPESILIVLVKEEGVTCDPSTSPIQPSSPYQLTRHGILKHQPLNLAPDWATITGVLLVIGLGTVVLTILAFVLKPSVSGSSPMKNWKPRWRSLGEPHIPPQYVLIRDSLPFYDAFGPWGPGEGPSTNEKDIFRGSGGPPRVKTLEDFSVRTLYDKLEDQNLHLASQLSKHRSDALAFYKGIDQQIQGLKEFLQELNRTKLQELKRNGDSPKESKVKVQKGTEQSEEFSRRNITASPEGSKQHHLGCVPAASSFDFQIELNRALAILINALSLSSWTVTETKETLKDQGKQMSSTDHGEEGSELNVDQHLSVSQQDSQPVAEEIPTSSEECSETRQERTLETTPAWKCQLYLQFPFDSKPQQNEGIHSEVPAKTEDPESPSLREQNTMTRDWGVTFPDLQNKIWQLEDTLDEMNEEFFQLSTQLLKLQTEGNKQDQEDKSNIREVDEPEGKTQESRVSKSDQILLLEVKRAHLAQNIEDVEWELSLLLHLADPSMNRREDQLDRHASLDLLPLH